jgi:hypothetical protein
MPDDSKESINIRPGVAIYSVLRHLNYKPWFAVAEFVDNSVQSFLDNVDTLVQLHGSTYRLRVTIDLEVNYGGRLAIRDNAAGIHSIDYRRAFRAAEVPLDRTGLSEFGMGMKSAACWFGRKWKVRTSALGEGYESTVMFDIGSIVRDETEILTVDRSPIGANQHFTEVIIDALNQIPQGRTVGKIKEHLASIYRIFIKSGQLELVFNGEALVFPEPAILKAPYFKSDGAETILWRKDIDLDMGLGMRVHGFAALRETGSTTEAGFALFRRNRLIDGSLDDSYRPDKIFGASTSYAYQRLFGELHLEGFEVSHTKDGFKWQEYEDIFLGFLKEDLDRDNLPLLSQAEGYRARPKNQNVSAGAEKATEHTAAIIRREMPRVIEEQIDSPLENSLPPSALPATVATSHREVTVDIRGQIWLVSLELSNDPAIGDWLSIADHRQNGETVGTRRRIAVRMSLAHPFMIRFGGVDAEKIEPILRLAVALALAEITARQSGEKFAGTIRRRVNDLLRESLSKP